MPRRRPRRAARDRAGGAEAVKANREHPCPRCGKPTTGTYSEGGIKWAICEDCMQREKADKETKEVKHGL